MKLTWQRRLTMSGLGTVLGIVGIFSYTRYGAYRGVHSACAQLFSTEEIVRWAGVPIGETQGFDREGKCGCGSDSVPRGPDMGHFLLLVHIEPMRFESAKSIWGDGAQLTSITGLGERAVRFVKLTRRETNILVGFHNGVLRVELGPEISATHEADVVEALRARLGAVQAYLDESAARSH